MSFPRIIGFLFTGAAVRLGGACLAVYVAVTVGDYLVRVFDSVNSGLSVLP